MEQEQPIRILHQSSEYLDVMLDQCRTYDPVLSSKMSGKDQVPTNQNKGMVYHRGRRRETAGGRCISPGECRLVNGLTKSDPRIATDVAKC